MSKYFVLCLAVLFSACATQVKQSQRNENYVGEIKNIALKWTMPKQYSIQISKQVSRYERGEIYESEKKAAQAAVTAQMVSLAIATPAMFAEEFKKKGIGFQKPNEAQMVLEINPAEKVRAECYTTCRSSFDVAVSLRDTQRNEIAWNGIVKVDANRKSNVPADIPNRFTDETQKQVKQDTNREFVELVMQELEKAKLIKAS
jgi:hypothetical protein